MNEPVTEQLLDEFRALQSHIVTLGQEVAGLRQEVSRINAVLQHGVVETPKAAIRRLWDEGLASGTAGDLDKVFDNVLAGLPGAVPKE
jgi:hypothetical protein